MGEDNSLDIEIQASATKANSALDKLIAKIESFQSSLTKSIPALKSFTAEMDKIASSSKAFASLKKFYDTEKEGADVTNKNVQATKKAESNMAMYQARLDRANVSMQRSQIQAEKLSAALEKTAQAKKFMADSDNSITDLAAKAVDRYVNGGTDKMSTEAAQSALQRQASESVSANHSMQPNVSDLRKAMSQPTQAQVNTSHSTKAIEEVTQYIERLKSSMNGISGDSAAQFANLEAQLRSLAAQIDNAATAYQNLKVKAQEAGASKGVGSEEYLKLESRVLKAGNSMNSLTAKQQKVAEKMEQIASTTNEAGSAMDKFGNKSERAGNKAKGAGQSTLTIIKHMMTGMIAFTAFQGVLNSITEGFKDAALGNKDANDTLSKYMSSFTYLKNAIAAPLLAILKAISPAITNIVDGIAAAANKLAIFIAQITGQKTVTIATKTNVDYAASLDKTGDSADKAKKKVKELQRTVMGFDELNVLNKKESSDSDSKKSSDPDYSKMFKTIPTPKSNWNFNDLFKNIKGVFDKIDDKRDKEEKATKKSVETVTQKVKEGAEAVAKAVQQIPVPSLEIPPVYVPPLDDGDYQKSKGRYQEPVAAPVFEPLIAPAVVLDYFLYGKALYQQPISAPEVQPAVIPALDSSLFLPSFEPVEEKVNSLSTNMQVSFGAAGTAMAASWAQSWSHIDSETSLKSQSAQKKLSGFSANSESIFSGMESTVTAATSAMWQSVLSQTSSKLNSQTGNKVSAFSKGANQSFQDIAKSIPTLAKTTWLAVLTSASYYLGETHNRVNAKLKGISDDFAKFGTNLQTNTQKTCQYQLTAFSTVFQNIGKALQSVGNWFSQAWNSAGKQTAAIQKTNPPKAGSDLAGALGGAGLISGAIPKILKLLGVAFSARGGITTSPILSVVGEAGSEAILPLNSSTFSALAKGIVENSKTSGESGSTVIANVFNVNGKTDSSILGESGAKVKQITDNLRTSADTRKKIVSDETDYTAKKYQEISASLNNSVPTLLKGISANVSDTSATIQTDTNTKWNGISTFIDGKFSGISKSANANFSAAKSFEQSNFASAERDVSSKASSMYSNASGKFKAISSDASTYFSKVKQSAQIYMSDSDNIVNQHSKAINNNVADKIGGAINGVVAGINSVLSAVGSKATVKPISIKHYAYGSGHHPGGAALVNDQSGSTYREMVQLPNGHAFIPQGRNVLIPDLPAGSSVLPAKQTKQMFPHYANGIGDFFGTSKAVLDTFSTNIWNYLDKPEMLLHAAIDKNTAMQSINFPWNEMEKSTVQFLTSHSVDFIKKQLAEFTAPGNGTVEAFLKIAESELGYLEKGSNSSLDDKAANAGHADFTKFGRDFGMNGAAWCDMFVSWCLKRAGVDEYLSASCEDSMSHFKSANRWTNNPARGDLIFYDWDKNGTADHIGIVESIASGLVNTIEGNTSGSDGAEGVFRKHRNSNSGNILGYGIPNFKSAMEVAMSAVANVGSGVEQWRSLASKALMMTGHYSTHNVDLLLAQMNTESSGQVDPSDLHDVNYYAGHPSKGLMQLIPETFSTYALPGYNTNILDPLSNILASIRYTWARYGSPDGVWGQGHGYAKGIGNIDWGGWNANGGIYDAPTLIGIGEKGKEAALPMRKESYAEIAQGIAEQQTNGNSANSSNQNELVNQVGAILAILQSNSGKPIQLHVTADLDGKSIYDSTQNYKAIDSRRYVPTH